jgi:hypothetical protein
VQPARRIEHVGQAEQVLLVAPASVVEHQQPLGGAVARTLDVHE